MQMPHFGERVLVKPTHPRVQAGEGAFGQFLGSEAKEVEFDVFWASRVLDGDVAIVVADPAATEPDPKPTRNKKSEQ